MSSLALDATVQQVANAKTALAPPPNDAFASAPTAVASPEYNAGSEFRLPGTTTSGGRTTVLPRILGNGSGLEVVSETRNRYEPLKLLGSGGMGEVLLVQDQDIARKVAVKRLLPEARDPMLLARFVDEIRTVGRLEHPNIVPVHDVGVDEVGRYFFVMKYVEGETLEQIIRKLAEGDAEYHRNYTFERRVEIMISVLNALEYAHANGVIHRDIKPANVMVGRYGEVVLMDWGIAKPMDSTRDLAQGPDATLGNENERGRMYMTHVGSLVGTPAYMSPEQARGELDKIDVRSDLYSAAVMLHEFVTCRHYLADETTTEGLLKAIKEQELEPGDLHKSCSLQSSLPAELVYVSLKGMAKDPGKRAYASASDFVAALQNVLAGTFSVTCKTTMTKRMFREMARAVDRYPRLSFYSFVGVVLAVIFAVFEAVRLVVT
ncbi:MAG: serine/threonine protein kinase [Polyangiaceae bacterium]|nr:serine/threonine protein kinase [Polyangiaceae bacterium]